MIEQQLKSTVITDIVVDGIIKFLEELFAQLPVFTWLEDETQTGIIIHDFDSFNLEDVDKRPRIAVEWVDGSWENLVVDKMQNFDLQRARKVFTDSIRTTVTLHCISKFPVEAKTLGSIVFEGTRMFREELRKSGGFQEIDSVTLGGVQRIRSSSQPEVRAIPVALKVSLKRTFVKVLDRVQFESSS